ncbi:MAG: nucleotidyltransferase domain-containing protein [Chitinispirillales bacterium]|jgi:predicted nucleotidyltransferase|nr:nucleotidyltransferase domain-containing protein [Chitinispirillales bacterium]
MERIYTITEIAQKLQPIFDAAPVEKAILFDSYAKGNPSKSSDIDIVIDSKGRIRGIDFFGVLEDITETLNIQVDLIEASQIIDGGRIQREIAETGVVIYEKA